MLLKLMFKSFHDNSKLSILFIVWSVLHGFY